MSIHKTACTAGKRNAHPGYSEHISAQRLHIQLSTHLARNREYWASVLQSGCSACPTKYNRSDLLRGQHRFDARDDEYEGIDHGRNCETAKITKDGSSSALTEHWVEKQSGKYELPADGL